MKPTLIVTTYAFIIYIMLVLIVTPVSAAQVSYSTAGIEFFASSSGGNELIPGTESDFTIKLTNNAQYQVVATESGLQRQYDAATPYQLRVSLENADGITVKNSMQTIPQISPGQSATITYRVAVDQYATPGPRTLKVHIIYNELFSVDNYGDALEYYWLNDRVRDVPIEITVRSQVSPKVLEISSEDINVGTSGYLTLSIKNAGGMNAKNAYALLSTSVLGGLPSVIVPIENSVFIGDFPAGSIHSVTFKISVANNAEIKEYPIGLQIVYQDNYGIEQKSSPIIVGVPVGGKTEFKVTDVKADLSPGGKGLIEITYKNTGNTKVYRAIARLSAIHPFSSNDDSAYLGDMAPGDAVTGIYEVTVDSDATEKGYGLDTEIRYHDANDNSILSRSMKAVVDVKKRTGPLSILTSPIFLSFIMAIVLIGSYYVFMKRKDKV
ncbi:MAG TPA: COG1361 S-layer family protein [Methanocorpusculum sp.]|nr:COG1361 S-layer family protein [Methanocorpusculum sp.]